MTRFLIISDTHFLSGETGSRIPPRRKTALTLGLLSRAVSEAKAFCPDAVLMLGDIINNKDDESAYDDMLKIRDELCSLNIPVIITTGNHDFPAETVLPLFGDHEGSHEINGVRVVSFCDYYGENGAIGRDTQKMRRFLPEQNTQTPLIVCQHNPIYPRQIGSHPFSAQQADEITELYASCGVLLSLSGHMHARFEPVKTRGTVFLICPSVCEEPHSYTLLEVEGGEFRYEFREISAP